MDVTTINEFLKTIFPSTFALVVTGLISVVIGVLLEKFKNRLILVKKRISYLPLATSTQNEYWGNIEVMYNGIETKHINFVTIYFNNSSNQDIEDINIEIWVDRNSRILGQSGNFVESGKAVFLEHNYFESYKNIIQANRINDQKKQQDKNHVTPIQLENDLDWLFKNRKFNLPYFNRKTNVSLNLLIENDNGEQPVINIDILHKSVRLIDDIDKEEYNKKLGLHSLGYGLLIYVISFIILLNIFPIAAKPLTIFLIIGALQLFIGFLIFYIIKTIKEYIV